MSGSASGNTSVFADADGNMSASSGTAGSIDDLLTAKMSGEELEKLLKQGAYAILGDNTADASAKYFEQDIETLLKTSAREIVHNPEGLISTENKSNELTKSRGKNGQSGGGSSSSSSSASSSSVTWQCIHAVILPSAVQTQD